MKIRFGLAWAPPNARKAFKSAQLGETFAEFVSRLDKFDGCEISKLEEKKPGAKLWLCHTAKNAKLLSSEELAAAVQNLRNSGVKELQIGIGSADGFSAADVARLAPDLLWSFGPMTYPHELAAVIAAEQMYRAYAILNNLPYHSGH